MVATDHSPCPPEMKHPETGRWDQAWGGISSLGLALPVMWTWMQQRGIKLERIGEWMAGTPARLSGLAGRKGKIAPGADADFAIFDPETEWTVSAADLHFRHKLSPYLGAELRGRVIETWLRGEPVFRIRAGKICGCRTRQRVGALMRDRAHRAIAECNRIAPMSEEPGRITRRFLTSPVSDVHRFCAGAWSLSEWPSDRCRRESARALEAAGRARQALDSRLAH